MNEMAQTKIDRTPAQQPRDRNEPIAIIGIGCRYPGGADSAEKFWKLLINGVDAITEIPADRADVAPYYDPVLAAPGKIATNQGGFLEKVDQFDAAFFGVSPREANYIDPQQRLLLETSWEALEDAGLVPDKLNGSQTGVFIGEWANDFAEKMYRTVDDINLYVTTGGGRYAASGRVSFFFGFQGPSMTVDTACSSSLVTVHLACKSLREGESNLALAGGANIILEPSVSIGYSRSKMLSQDGRCKFGDARANGYVRSEGVGIVVLKRLSDAVADGDPIYAVIRGSAVNNDGRSSELLVAPGVSSQVKMLREAYRSAGVDPSQVGYVEAHGTGTPVGDPVELEALGTVLSENRDPGKPCRVGSVKTNIGHTESASGVAGLIKAALCLKHRAIPASLHYQSPNPKIHWSELGLRIQASLAPWPEEFSPAVAAVNSFGITGTNAHVVLEEAPRREPAPQDPAQEAFLLPLSAQTPEGLRALAAAFQELLAAEDSPDLGSLCYTAGPRRSHHAWRAAAAGASRQELAEQLAMAVEQKLQGDASQPAVRPQARVVFAFPGQGGQWAGMGRALMRQNAAFRTALARCDAACRKWTDWSILEQLSLDEDSPGCRLNEIGVIQPTLFAMEVALAEMWRSWGVKPSAVLGHSMGEVAAAYIAGALSLDDAAHVICERSRLMQRTSGRGAMAVVGLPFAEAEAEIAASGCDGLLSIAVQNSPRSVVISGDPGALSGLMEKLRGRDIFCRMVKVDVASHSPQMDPLRPELVSALSGLQPALAAVPYYSTVTQDLYEGQSLDAEYWGRNLRQPVRFSGTVQRLLEEGHTVFIEMSPHPVLLSSIDEVCKELGHAAVGIASLRRGQPELLTMLGQLGALYAQGYRVDWEKLYPQGGEVVSLPAYPWQRERCWFEASSSAKQARPGSHPLLGQYTRTADGTHIWETSLSLKAFPYLADHRVRGSAVFPAAGYMEMVLAGAAEAFGAPVTVRRAAYEEALFLPETGEQILQLVMTQENPESAGFRIYSRAADQDSTASWTLHASGTVEIDRHAQDAGPESQEIFARLRASEQPETGADDFYASVSGRGLDYGETFRSVLQLGQSSQGILAKVALPESLSAGAGKYLLHPVLLDACFQALLAALPASDQDTYLPSSLESLQMHSAPDFGGELWCCALPGGVSGGDLFLFNPDGKPVLSARGLVMRRVTAQAGDIQPLLYQIDWEESPLPEAAPATPVRWLVFADQQGAGIALAEHLRQEGHTAITVRAGSSYHCAGQDLYELDPLRPEQYARLLAEVPQPLAGIAHLWSLDAAVEPAPGDPALLSLLYTAQAASQVEGYASPRLAIVTRGAQGDLAAAPPRRAVSQASAWGLGAVIANELPGLRCLRVDLDPGTSADANLLARALLASEATDSEAGAAAVEDQIALRDGRRYAARLNPLPLPADGQRSVRRKFRDEGLPFRVETLEPGIIDRLAARPTLRRAPGPGEVEIEVKATGLNFMNVMAALGMLPGYAGGVGPLGIECAGVVARVGDGVSGFRPGDEVAAVAFDSLASHAVTDARLVVKKPASLSFAQAAGIPIAYLTAWYALGDLGRMRAGERVLIHSATGGVGLAAVYLAKRAGAEIFATAGSTEKREYLKAMGIEHVMDSRSLSFADEILRVTGGEGVDLVLNSLAGRAIPRGLEILRPYGRFLEIGKRDIYQDSKIGLFAFQKNVSFFAIDLDKMSRERPEIVGEMLRAVFRLVAAGEIPALPAQSFPVSQVSEAFRAMAQARHTGKIVIDVSDPEAGYEAPAGVAPVHSDGTYMITGGLGGLGLEFARWLALRGARHLVLVGRSEPSLTAQTAIEALRGAGVELVTARADAASREQMEAVFTELSRSLPPLRGVIHAAGVLADSTIQQMDREQFERAYAPKAQGAWNLHILTAGQPLDFFILISSVAATLGLPGQANYAAGNAFMDGLARFRRAQGLPALSINWGPWSEIGLAAQQANRGERLTRQGLKSITPTQGMLAFSAVSAGENAQVTVVDLDGRRWREAQPGAAHSSLFRNWKEEAAAGQAETVGQAREKSAREELLAAEVGRQRSALFDALLREQVAQVLRMPAQRIPSDKPLKTLGLDSLMSIELVNRLEKTLGLSLSVAMIWNYPSVAALAPALAEKMGIPLEAQGPAGEEKESATVAGVPAAAQPAAELLASEEPGKMGELDDLDKEDLEALLADELSAIDETLKGSGSGAEN